MLAQRRNCKSLLAAGLIIFSLPSSLSLSLYRFSAVVRQEVAPPPPAETTPFRPNGGVSSISSESENVAPPPAAATVGVNSIPKTDSSSTGSNSSSKSELLSDSGIQPASGDSSAGLLDTPTTLAAAKDDSRSADSASAAKEVAEVKDQDAATKGTSEESATEQVCICVEAGVILNVWLSILADR